MKALKLKCRIALLKGRTRPNERIIRKLERQLRNIEGE